MMKTLTLLALCACFLASCKQSNVFNRQHATDKIDLSKMDSPSFFDYFSKIELIPLETSDTCLIKDFNERIYYKGNFYFCDRAQKQVLAFDSDGKFLYKVDKAGNGPGEYSSLSSFQFNPFTGDLDLLIPMGGIYKYDSLG